MTYDEILSKVSKDLNIPKIVIDRTYKSFWLFIKDTIQTIPLKEDLNEEEFSKLRTSFNIPSLGKLSCSYKRMIGIKNRFNLFNKTKKDI